MTPIPQLLGGAQAPKTAQELQGLSASRDELRGQLESLNDRRRELADQIARLGTNDPIVRADPVARLKALDQRINQVEADIDRADKLISDAMAKGVAREPQTEVHVFPEAPALPPIPIEGVFPGVPPESWQDRLGPTLATTVPITLASVVLLGALLYWRISRSVRNQLTKILATQSGRLDELQRSVDSVAVEMERVSENQRFVTKLVGERPGAVERR